MDAATTSEVGCFALYRGQDRNGAMQTEWKRLNEAPMSLADAKEECGGMFGCGLLWHPLNAEFRVCAIDGTPLSEARPPHADALKWEAPTPIAELPNDPEKHSFSLPPMAGLVGHVQAGTDPVT